MIFIDEVDSIRISAGKKLVSTKKGELGQFFTSAPIALFMSSLFSKLESNITLLDPGCGSCILSAAFINECFRRGKTSSLKIDAYDIESNIKKEVLQTINICEKKANKLGVKLQAQFILGDFIRHSRDLFINNKNNSVEIESYSHVIMNPPYKKINKNSEQSKLLTEINLNSINLYSGFISIAIKRLKKYGELVAIIPRSFCNGPYYKSLREQILNETAIKHIHIFEKRNNAFSEDGVLQENIIIHLIKGAEQGNVTITSSPNSDFSIDEESKTLTVPDMTIREVEFNTVIHSNDKHKFIYITANDRDQNTLNHIKTFNSCLNDLNISVSTGAVVDFRLREELRENPEKNSVPLIYPIHLKNTVEWPKKSKKPNAIMVSDKSKPYLWKNDGYYVVVRRFSSKEEKHRIVASIYDGSIKTEMIGFDNKLNVFHFNKKGINKELAFGLYVYLNSTLLDKFYRLFGGNTQVNATDLRNIIYPDLDSLYRIGSQIKNTNLSQQDIDNLIETEIYNMTGKKDNNVLLMQEKIDNALEIIKLLGLPRTQQNERSALTLLALLNLHSEKTWEEIECPMKGVTPIMDWCKSVYGKEYAPNTRETFRRQTLHQFVSGGLCLYNPDDPSRAVNSPKACYQITEELFNVLKTYGTPDWEKQLDSWLKNKETLISKYAKQRDMKMIPLTLDDGTEVKLSPGKHSQLIHDIVVEFGPRFIPGAQVIYLGDTGAKENFFRKNNLEKLGVVVNRKGKLPDVVLYWPKKNWLILVESVTSHGPVDGKRHEELAHLFKKSIAGLVYVTAFPDRKIMGRYLSEISWETEVWVAEAPTHMIHFNGDRFLGPHNQ